MKRGFTLLEVLITVLVIGVVAGISLPVFLNTVERMRGAEAIEILFKCYSGYMKLVDDSEPIGGGNPLTFARMGMSDPATIPAARRFFNYTIRNNAMGNPTSIRATRANNAAQRIEIALSTGVITKTVPY